MLEQIYGAFYWQHQINIFYNVFPVVRCTRGAVGIVQRGPHMDTSARAPGVHVIIIIGAVVVVLFVVNYASNKLNIFKHDFNFFIIFSRRV